MKITLMYGTTEQNDALQIIRVTGGLQTNALVITNRLSEKDIQALIKATHESEAEHEVGHIDTHILLLTNDPDINVLEMVSWATTFPEIVSIRWSGNWTFDATQAFRAIPWPTVKEG